MTARSGESSDKGSVKDAIPADVSVRELAKTEPNPILPSVANVRRSWYRATFTQATILGICSFLAPGLWGAMNSLGAGGQSSPGTVNAANALTFVLMIFTSWGTSSLINLTSVPIALAIGTSGYGVYAAGLYLSSKTDGAVTWLVVFGAACCGISAGFFWSTEGAIILSYPERHKLGRYVSYWLSFRVLGQLIGGAINLGLNAKNSRKGSISVGTYTVFIALQCLGPLAAMCISRPERVQRSDGTPVVLNLKGSVRAELLAVWKLICTKKVALLLPMIWQTTFSESLTGTYAATYMTVRSRALGSFLSAIVAILCNAILGFFLDWRKISINTRSKFSFLTVYALQCGCWIFAIVVMNRLHRHPPAAGFDWADQGSFPTHFALYIFLQASFNMMYELTYFIVSSINDDGGDTVRLASIVRGVESAGQALSYGINATSWRLDAVAGLNFGFYAICLVPAWIVIRNIGILPDGTKIYAPLARTGESVDDATSRSQASSPGQDKQA
ncbi:unnamed protein product [Parajaminaea phylloscopi]